MNDYQNNVKVVDGILLLKKVNSFTNPLITGNIPDANEVIFYADQNGTLKIKNQDGDYLVGGSAEITTTSLETSVGTGANGASDGAAFGYFSNGASRGVAVGHSANGSLYGSALGSLSDGSSYGVGIGSGSDGHSYGATFGCNSNGYVGGTAIGYNSHAPNYSVAIGNYSSTIGTINRIEIAPKDSFGAINARASAQSTSKNWQFTSAQSDTAPTDDPTNDFGNADGTLPRGMWSAQISADGSNLVFYVNVNGVIKSGSVALT